MQSRRNVFHTRGGHGMLKKYYRTRYYCFFFAFQWLVFSFLVFFSGFVVKARIASHHFSKEFILSPKLFKALIFFNISFTKSVKPLFLSMYIFWGFHQKYYLFYTPSEQFRRFSLKLQNMSLSPRDKYKKILIFFWEDKER